MQLFLGIMRKYLVHGLREPCKIPERIGEKTESLGKLWNFTKNLKNCNQLLTSFQIENHNKKFTAASHKRLYESMKR